MKLSKMKNIGIELERRLTHAGIKDASQLIELGAVCAATKLDACCLNTLYALEGAIADVRWHDLSEIHRRELRLAYNQAMENIDGLNHENA